MKIEVCKVSGSKSEYNILLKLMSWFVTEPRFTADVSKLIIVEAAP